MGENFSSAIKVNISISTEYTCDGGGGCRDGEKGGEDNWVQFGVVGGSQGIANIIALFFQIGPNIMATTHTQHLPTH